MSSRLSLAGFCVLAYGFSWLCWIPIGFAQAGRLKLPISTEGLATLGQFGPFFAALVFTALESKPGGVRDLLARLRRLRVNPIWYGVALLLPPAGIYCAIGAQAAIRGNTFALPTFGEPSTLLPHLAITLVIGGPLGEELGWRGFALPRLRAAFRPIMASLLLGFIWAGWHLPLWWIADVPTSFGLYVVGVIPLTYLFTWMWDHTNGSVLIAMLFHASLNMSPARLPVQPAWREWTAILWLIAVPVAAFDARLNARRPRRSRAA